MIKQSRAELDRLAFPPFRSGIGAGAMAVMSAHLDVKAVDPGTPRRSPASCSPTCCAASSASRAW
ncbi:hypothetical protein V2I01_03735 [Micromonospora sp. BRA006-A]|nr:hypothetical protein [Micromonospora sp. BRA006-A]